MQDYQMGVIESKFADIIWENEPISSTELVKVCEKEFNWKKSTTYTMIKKLCEKQFAKSENAIVTSLIPKEEVRMN